MKYLYSYWFSKEETNSFSWELEVEHKNGESIERSKSMEKWSVLEEFNKSEKICIDVTGRFIKNDGDVSKCNNN